MYEIQTLINTVIEYRIVSVYGRENIYVVSDHAKAISELTRRKTIDATDIHALELLGFTFKQVL